MFAELEILDFMLPSGLLIICALSALATVTLAWNGVAVCTRLGLMDEPDDRKLHQVSTPLLGGLTLSAIILPCIVFDVLILVPKGFQQSLLFFGLVVLSITLLGMADDRRSLAARDRILLSMLAFGSVALVDPLFNVRVLDFAAFDLELGLGLLPIGVAFTTLCCVGLVNAVNMADGKNGLVIGLCIGWLILLATRAPMPIVFVIAILLAGLAVLLGFNLAGRLFLGDGGSYGFSAAVGLVAIATYNTRGTHMGRAITADELMLLFATPVLDSFRLTFIRLRRGQSPMSADRDHLHHHLQDKFGWPVGLIVYLVIALTPAAAVFVR